MRERNDIMDNDALIDHLRRQAKHNLDEALLHDAADRLELYVMELRRLTVLDSDLASLRKRVAELEEEVQDRAATQNHLYETIGALRKPVAELTAVFRAIHPDEP